MADEQPPSSHGDRAMHIAITPAGLRMALARFARGRDDRAQATSLLLLLRAAADQHGRAVELSSHDEGTLATIEGADDGLFLAELVPISMETISRAFLESPELAASFVRRRERGGVVLRALDGGAYRASEESLRSTSPSLPSLELLVEAGLAPPGALD